MGTSSSKEIVAAQSQVRSLTAELQKAQAILAQQTGKAEKAEVYERQVAQLSGQLSMEKANLELMTAELRREQQKMTQKQSMLQQLKREKDEAQRKLMEEAEAKQRELEAANTALLQSAGQTLDADRHPTYGKLLIDFGFKRVYAAKAVTLMAQAQIWKKQRALREHRSSKIADSKSRSNVPGWPGTVTVVERRDDGSNEPQMFIVDGQHRLAACLFLSSKNKLTEATEVVLLEVYSDLQDKDMSDLFVEINKAEPVLSIDLPMPEIGGATVSENAILTGAADLLQNKYKAMFKESHNCRVPHMNIDRLRDELHKAGVVEKLSMKQPEELYEWLEKQNDALTKCDNSRFIDQNSSAAKAKALEKAREHGFYLGMDWKWLESG
eukprot:Tamp_16627.p1 GENE.Tamp_16627~~Tamp_16627.p1  ORF type:complete len:382 (+),score=103.03 Tamp_16627:1-1146(+)